MRAWTLLPVAFVVVPIVEIAVIISVGQAIGVGPTVVLLLVESALGAWLVRREGSRAWRALTGAIRTGHLPGRELTDAALVLVGGTLLLTPGFVTDVVGVLLVLPPTRPPARRLLQAYIARRATSLATGARSRLRNPWPGGSGPRSDGESGGGPSGSHRAGPVVPGEVVDTDDQPPP